ncbi:hypothetical protein Dfer_1239 [Sporocytophaga myxococcoides]|uniref:Uncharacterized protein n=1 Tax=Sporocytophaga myxococcoides TaxID=153721 RepID=A0A098L9A0_9BACT|nr:enzyme of heme biosynthesis [Sporocytophaga myxococcoides]GAL83476.1 hypothetical protein Dfer_1239 [Sporocytophaga myxococcoides]
MNNSRLELLLQYYKEDPQDPFTIYALAIEYLNTDVQKSVNYFSILLENHEDYTGTYYHAANLFFKLGQLEKAEEVYKKGLEITFKVKDMKANQELRSAYNQFLDEISEE